MGLARLVAVTRLDSDGIPGRQRLSSFTFYCAHGPHLTPLLPVVRCLHETPLYLLSASSHIPTMVQAHQPHCPHLLTNLTRPRNAGMIIYHFVVSAVNSFLNGGLIFRVASPGTVGLILAPHPSLLYVLVDFHLKTLRQPLLFATHLIITYGLTFMAFSSLIVCIARDPGPVTLNASPSANGTSDNEVGLTEALMPDTDLSEPGRWCRKCWVTSVLLKHVYVDLIGAHRPQNLKGRTTVVHVDAVY